MIDDRLAEQMSETLKIPSHVAIIMDGNGRWARARGLERFEGHLRGVESVRQAIKSSLRHGVRYLTLYVFSTENWGRPDKEVDSLMELFCRCVIDETPQLVEQAVRVKIIGDRSGLPAKVIEYLERIENETAGGDALTVLLALNYSSRREIELAVREIASRIVSGDLTPSQIDDRMVSQHLFTADYPDPDLLIRTGGDHRLSNFLLWQAAYTELYFTDTYWPDFGAAQFDAAIAEYCARERRFGLVKETASTKIPNEF